MRRSHIVSTLAAALAAAVPAVADEAKDGETAPLPGVKGGYTIVAPAPEPMPEPTNDPRHGASFKAGNWDVTVSGFVSVQIGTTPPNSKGR